MKVQVQEHTLIDIPDTPSDGSNDSTSRIEAPYLGVLRKQSKEGKGFTTTRSVRVRCLSAVYEKIKGQFHTFYEPMGGVGVTASIFTQSGESGIVNELDPECVEVIRKNFPNFEVHNEDMNEFEPDSEYDCAFLDFNNFTLKKFVDGGVFNEVTNRTFEYSEKYVIINDCSPFYLSRGAKSFEVYSRILEETITDMDGYYTALRNFYHGAFPEWNLEFVERFYQSGYLVFKKGGQKTGAVENTLHDSKLEKDCPSLKIIQEPARNRLF